MSCRQTAGDGLRGYTGRAALFLANGGVMMIKHVVCFKLKDNSAVEKQIAKEVLCSMQGKVPQIQDLFVGINFLESERSYDVILEVLLQDRAALDAYQADPYHVSVVKKHMHHVQQSSVSIDCEL